MYLVAWIDRAYPRRRGLLTGQYSAEDAEAIIKVREVMFPREECQKVEFPDWSEMRLARPVAEPEEAF